MRRLQTILWLMLFVAACSSESEQDVADRLDARSSRDVLAEASEDEYDPPPDGRLTEEQVEMYLEVREREQEIARVARERVKAGAEKIKGNEKSLSGLLEGVKSLGSAADFFTADVRAAQELGYNTAEYEWVKSQILEAAGSVLRARMAVASRGAADEHASELRRKMESTDNETERNTYARLLEAYERTLGSPEESEPDPSVAYNLELLSRYEDALDTIGLELSKFETREGQAAEKIEKLDEELPPLPENPPRS